MHKHIRTAGKHYGKAVLKYRSLRHHHRLSLLAGILLIAVLLFAISPLRELAFPHSKQASFYFVAPTEVGADQTFDFEVHIDTQGNTTNAISTVMKFNPKLFEIINMTTAESFCSFYTENSFDTIKGNVELSCGSPNPGFNGTSPVLLIKMRSKVIGKDVFTLDKNETKILANDGKGTNLVNSLPTATIQVKQTL